MNYRDAGLLTYGHNCEICAHSAVEVHHIDYQEHQQVEDMLRYLWKNGQDYSKELAEAQAKGYLTFKNGQLAKDDRTTNTSVLCGNCHNLVHRIDVGKKLLKALQPRK